jgi:hypothetical protein
MATLHNFAIIGTYVWDLDIEEPVAFLDPDALDDEYLDEALCRAVLGVTQAELEDECNA